MLFQSTHTRLNKTSENPKSPHYQNSPESHLIVSVRASTPEGARKRAETYWRDRGMFGGDWKFVSAVDLDADPE